MPVLCTFSYPQGAQFTVVRPYLIAFAIGWQPDAFYNATGQTTELEEVSFGGYKLVIGFKDWCWNFDNRSMQLDDLFEDFYAIAPGGGPPISAGTAQIDYEIDTTFLCPMINITLPAPAPHYLLQRFPEAPGDYWLQPASKLPATPFWFP